MINITSKHLDAAAAQTMSPARRAISWAISLALIGAFFFGVQKAFSKLGVQDASVMTTGQIALLVLLYTIGYYIGRFDGKWGERVRVLNQQLLYEDSVPVGSYKFDEYGQRHVKQENGSWKIMRRSRRRRAWNACG
jgi:surface polysaccharide O-acyltransferase-like enzyme